MMKESIWIATAFVLVIPLLFVMRSTKWSVKGKHVFITGGSQGLGLALAELVVSKGADVTICSRSQAKLESAVEEIKKFAESGQKVAYVAADVSTFEGARKALELASGQDQGKVARVPDVVFCCAGASKPGYFLEQDESHFTEGIKTIYMTALSTAHAATQLFVANKKWDGKLVLTGSTLSFVGIVGYAQYAPMKWAIRGLAETLRSEFLLYKGLSVHAYFPGTILSPGFIEEEKTKPKVTQSIEDGEKGGQMPMQCAKKLLKGVENDVFLITSDFDTELLRVATSAGGACPGNNFVVDRIKSIIALIGVTFWRIFTADASIRKFAKQSPDQVPGLQ
ncbi:NAD(P)-binding protein [Meira miltonrushii]|uniref:3-dehydrosphinganine reductase n=1 Tax=Meira miltonrushii TaxID=1280837 RepID=A0A316V819_9BASI|nr:NAD(P)-binding protein [Meira miltonrushii]PWN32343.1 NAD(P)-binding protein [Meira miltonrushii]